MNKNIVSTCILAVISLLLVSGLLYYAGTIKKIDKQMHCIPTFADGDGPYYQANAPFRNTLSPSDSTGEKLIISGTLKEKDCDTPVPNAIIDIWHASPDGVYEQNWYRGKIRTDKKGKYTFETVMPKGYGEGTAHRPPHIHFKIVVRDNLIITSEMFFPEIKGTPGFDDAYIMSTQEKSVNGSDVIYGYHDIILPSF